ncbi:MAG: hypothetical protein IPL15_10185 [Comamonadaceae bacterium]|uniref:GGDEF domain-containing protein n=1 Tax=Candidatus Skiveiella danica TaxID=3386177 RepID=UPI00390A2AF8|nr:hypothetical protein [Comamonadaceae bacterium]
MASRPSTTGTARRSATPRGGSLLRHAAPDLRPADTIARLGGDNEFALILMDCGGGDACLLLERCNGLAGSPLSVPGGAVPLRFSAGVAGASSG